MRRPFWAAIISCAFVLLTAVTPAHAQTPTATTAVVSGAVADPSGAMIPGATVLLVDVGTSRSTEQITDDNGRYVFVGVLPGRYSVTVKLTGFNQARVPEIPVEVAKAYTVDVTMQVGEMSEVVDVKASSAVELQKADATIGQTLSAQVVMRLPNPTRDLTSIQFNQPLATPYSGADSGRSRGGSIAGSRTDQNTYTLDGADVSDNVTGTNFLETLPSAAIPLPAESVEEFRVSSANANATFARASGGQLVVVTKRGTNTFKGSGYWYRQDDALNSNTWTRNRLGIEKPNLQDDRFGGSLGGRLWRDKTFFFTNYEGRRFPRATDVTRIVPTEEMKAGILRFRDAAGNVVNYNVGGFDPRGIGMNPVVADVFRLMPAGNDPSQGDGLNTTGFTSAADTSLNSDFAVLRLDHNLSTNWRLDTSYRYASIAETGAAQVDIGGVLPGNVKGQAFGTETLPREPRFFAFGLSGQITPKFVNEIRVGYNRGYLGFTRVNPSSPVSSSNMALDLGGTLLDEPLDMITGRSRSQVSNSRTLQITNNANWLLGDHTLSFGGTFRRTAWFFGRNDLLTGPLTALSATIDDANFINIPATARPATCGAGVSANCLIAADVTRWNRLYTTALGMVDNIGVLLVRDGQLNAQPPGTFLDVDTRQNGYEFYFNDAWRVSPSLTVSAGLNYQWYASPSERDGRFAYLIDNASGEILTSENYLQRARDAALAGGAYNPQLAFLPLESSGRDSFYDVDYGNVGPRVSAAWSPSYKSGLGKMLFADGKAVLRGGYGLTFDRQNNVNLGSWQMGVGFAQTLLINGPRCNVAGAGGAGCVPGGTDPAAAFRLGVDGTTPIPGVPSVTNPVVPPEPFGETATRHVDPDLRNGRTHGFNLSYQRELPGDLLVEGGWVLRLGRNLNQGYVLSSVPYFHTDRVSGQTFAQAYDTIANQLRSGVAPAAIAAQPWFESLVGPGQSAALAAALSGDFIDGNVSNIWLVLNNTRVSRGLESLSNRQVQTLWSRGDGGHSYYQAMFITARKRMSDGLTFNANYTLSAARDQIGVAQNTSTAFSTSFDPDVDYGPSSFDRRHVFNLSWLYELPFGASGGALSRVTGGWYVAGVYSAASGVPLDVCQRAGVYGGGLTFATCTGAIPTGGADLGVGVNSGVAGGGGIGTSGNPAAGGTGLNLFADPQAVFNSFRRVNISEDTRAGRGAIYGLPRWNVDLSIGKRTRLSERTNLLISADVFNVFNTVQFSNPAMNLTSPATFGVITAQGNDARAVQLAVRFEF